MICPRRGAKLSARKNRGARTTGDKNIERRKRTRTATGNPMRATTIIIGPMIALTGCCCTPGTVPYEPAPLCSSAKECEVKWEAARRWVNDHCGFSLHIDASDYMQTDFLGDDKTLLACRVSKEPISETEYRIVVQVGCRASISGCQDARKDRYWLSLQDIRNAFNGAVSAAWVQHPAVATTPGSAP